MKTSLLRTSNLSTKAKTNTKTPASKAKLVERVSGRLGMQGLFWGGLNEMMLNENFQQQLQDPHNLMTAAAVTTLVVGGSAFTKNDYNDTAYFAWTPEAEELNGRLAMVGILAAFVAGV